MVKVSVDEEELRVDEEELDMEADEMLDAKEDVDVVGMKEVVRCRGAGAVDEEAEACE